MMERELSTYTQRGNAAFEAELARRSATNEGAFFLPHLRPGMRLLDLGSGPGSITIGLAEALAPGEVVGIDAQPTQVERARALSAERGVTNATFEVADAYNLPFPDNSFDAAFAHVVLMHLTDPIRALVEVHRVLRPGGVVGVRDPDMGSAIRYSMTPILEQYMALMPRVLQHNGGDPYRARSHRGLLLEAGFARTEGGASVRVQGSVEKCREIAGFFKAQLVAMGKTALAQGWIDTATLDAIPAELDAWAERPDAFNAATFCETIGWRD
jgi:ubiquinone/menaquinone biosynthesis C-methylase UbiE